jgi:ribosome maturation factor RimP
VSASRGTQRTDPATSRLIGWIEPIVSAAGYDLEELTVTPAGRRSVVRVVVDRDSGVTLDDVAEVSRVVSEELDTQDDGMGRTPYVLEVTSPGVDRPLTEERHWRRNIGRLVTVAVGPAGSTDVLTGRITDVTAAGVDLAVEAPGKPGAKKRPPTPRSVAWNQLGVGRVQVEFGRHEEQGGPDDDLIDDAPGATQNGTQNGTSSANGGRL